LEAFVEMLQSRPTLDVSEAKAVLDELKSLFQERRNLAAREVMFPVRASLTGSLHGPNLAVVMALLGKDRCLQRATHTESSFS
jgi:nondiscriminating glutamyl-tRNA synthetase